MTCIPLSSKARAKPPVGSSRPPRARAAYEATGRSATNAHIAPTAVFTWSGSPAACDSSSRISASSRAFAARAG